VTTTRHRIKTAARRLGYEVTIFRNSVAGQRAQLLRHLGIQRVVDVGANVGQYADSLRELGYRGEIWSFEPLASAYAELERRSQGDSSWRATRTAVGAREGELQLHVSQSSIFSSALPVLDSAVSASPDARSVREEVVPMNTLDGLLGSQDLSRTAIKVDVQGFERDVLDGAAVSLPHVPMVELELTPEPIYEGQMLMLEAVERLQAAGLVLACVENLFRDDSGRSLQFNGIFVRS
jgi:FkbM family methyltransferase